MPLRVYARTTPALAGSTGASGDPRELHAPGHAGSGFIFTHPGTECQDVGKRRGWREDSARYGGGEAVQVPQRSGSCAVARDTPLVRPPVQGASGAPGIEDCRLGVGQAHSICPVPDGGFVAAVLRALEPDAVPDLDTSTEVPPGGHLDLILRIALAEFGFHLPSPPDFPSIHKNHPEYGIRFQGTNCLPGSTRGTQFVIRTPDIVARPDSHPPIQVSPGSQFDLTRTFTKSVFHAALPPFSNWIHS